MVGQHPNYKNYDIYDDGRVFSHFTNKFLTLHDDGNGYLYVSRMKNNNGQYKSPKIARLVAETFIPNPNNLPCVNHKDTNRKNNKVENLQWCTYSYNNTYKDRLQKIIQKTKNNPKLSKKVNMYNLSGDFEKTFPSVRQAARFLGDVKKSSNITACLQNRQKTAYGHIWKYEDCGN